MSSDTTTLSYGSVSAKSTPWQCCFIPLVLALVPVAGLFLLSSSVGAYALILGSLFAPINLILTITLAVVLRNDMFALFVSVSTALVALANTCLLVFFAIHGIPHGVC